MQRKVVKMRKNLQIFLGMLWFKDQFGLWLHLYKQFVGVFCVIEIARNAECAQYFATLCSVIVTWGTLIVRIVLLPWHCSPHFSKCCETAISYQIAFKIFLWIPNGVIYGSWNFFANPRHPIFMLFLCNATMTWGQFLTESKLLSWHGV